jgi:hypothetical protein
VSSVRGQALADVPVKNTSPPAHVPAAKGPIAAVTPPSPRPPAAQAPTTSSPQSTAAPTPSIPSGGSSSSAPTSPPAGETGTTTGTGTTGSGDTPVEEVDPAASRAIAGGVLSLLQGVDVPSGRSEERALGSVVANLCAELLAALPPVEGVPGQPLASCEG